MKAGKRIILGHRFRDFSAPDSIGIVKDAVFIMCFWPKLDMPTSLFAAGSSGLEVLGHPTPRNVLFPEDTVFHDYLPDALYPAELAVLSQFPARKNMVGLSSAEAEVWKDAYAKAVKVLPPTATRLSSRDDVFFLRERLEKSRRVKVMAVDSSNIAMDGSVTILAKGAQITKIEYDEFVCEIAKADARKPRDQLRKAVRDADFRHLKDASLTLAKAKAAKGVK